MINMTATTTNTADKKKANLVLLITLLLQCSDSYSFQPSPNDNNKIYHRLRPGTYPSSRFADTKGQDMFEKPTRKELSINDEKSVEKWSNEYQEEQSRNIIEARYESSAIILDDLIESSWETNKVLDGNTAWSKALVDFNRRIAGFLISSPMSDNIMNSRSQKQLTSISKTTNNIGMIAAAGLSILLIATLFSSLTFLEGESLSCICWSAWTSYICTMVSRVALK